MRGVPTTMSREALNDWLSHVCIVDRSEQPKLVRFFSSLRDSNKSLPYQQSSLDTISKLTEGYTSVRFVTELNTISAMLTDAELEMCLRVQLAIRAALS